MTEVQYRIEEGPLGAETAASVARLFETCFGEAPDPDFAGRVAEKRRLVTVLAYDAGTLVGYKLGYERYRGIFQSWLGGVDPAHRRRGIARTMLRMQHELLRERGYEKVETETSNRFRGMLLLNLVEGFDIVGTVLDGRRGLMIVLQKPLAVPPL